MKCAADCGCGALCIKHGVCGHAAQCSNLNSRGVLAAMPGLDIPRVLCPVLVGWGFNPPASGYCIVLSCLGAGISALCLLDGVSIPQLPLGAGDNSEDELVEVL